MKLTRRQAMGAAAKPDPGNIDNVEPPGFAGKPPWTQEAAGLRVQMPPAQPCDYAMALKITPA